MPAFSDTSLTKLAQCDTRLQDLFNLVITEFDCSVLTGFRGREEQEEKLRQGLSKVNYPYSKHNQSPSAAIDVAPYPIDWQDRERFHYFAGLVKGIASRLHTGIRWGGDWDSDTEVRDNNFDDLPHFELVQVNPSE